MKKTLRSKFTDQSLKNQLKLQGRIDISEVIHEEQKV